jgi:hypothetical protein
MRLMRKLLKLDPDKFEDVEFYEFVDAIKKYMKDENIKFQERFSKLLDSKNVLLTCSFDEDVAKGQPLPKLKKLVEDVLTKDKICAVSIMFNEHIATGCFDAKVEFHDFNHTMNLLMHLLIMCLFCQTRKAYFVDSNYAEFWLRGLKMPTYESILRPTRATAQEFGARVVMDIKSPNNVENFMLCLYWWISCRWSDNPVRNRVIRCVIWGVDGEDYIE